jgi:hypothetical protein
MENKDDDDKRFGERQIGPQIMQRILYAFIFKNQS